MGKFRSRLLLLALFAVLVSLLTPGRGFAQTPPIPMVVSGSVTLNGSPAPDGLNLTAWDSSEFVGSTTTSGGNYSVQVCGVVGQICNENDTISFQLGGVGTNQTTSFGLGLAVNLDLAFTGTPIQAAITTTTQPTVTPASNQTTTTNTTMTELIGTATPEYPNYLPVTLLAVLITLGVIASLGKKKRND